MRADRPNARKLKALKRGHLAEFRAALCLMVKGYRIVAMRYHTKLGEIDIIARRGDLIACVEVKDLKQLRRGGLRRLRYGATADQGGKRRLALTPGGFSPPLRHRRRHVLALAAAPAGCFLTKQANL